ncbi:MAG: transposase [Gammaproteobacteria bacterium]|nr:transposase [Gammaproteobacteria bacterium]
MKKTKQKHLAYTKSFKMAAVCLAEHPGFLTQDVALALDIHPFMLSRWKKEHRDGLLKGAVEENIKEMEEKVAEQALLRQFEKRIKRLEMENDMLKKSIDFASKLNEISTPS